MVRLGDVCEISIGKTPARKNPEYWGKGHPWLSIRDMNQGRFLSATAEQITDLAVRETSPRLCEPGTVLFSFKLSIGKVGIAQIPLYTNEAIAAFVPLEAKTLLNEYLFHALQYFGSNLEGQRAVMGQTLNKASLSQITIPLPPLDEQRRIAAILDEVNRIQALVSGWEALVRQFEESIFRGFAQNAPTSPLEDLSVAVIDCPHSTPKWAEEGEICLWTGNLAVGSLKWDKRRYVSSKTFEERTKRAELVEGDIVLSREGTVGIAAKIPAGLRACMGQRLVQVRPDLEKTSSNWLLQSILYSLDPNRIGMLMVGATSKHLNVKDLRKLKVPVLGPAELSRFETQIEMTDKLRQLLSKRFELVAELQKSLSTRAFQGEL